MPNSHYAAIGGKSGHALPAVTILDLRQDAASRACDNQSLSTSRPRTKPQAEPAESQHWPCVHDMPTRLPILSLRVRVNADFSC